MFGKDFYFMQIPNTLFLLIFKGPAGKCESQVDLKSSVS